jgi:TP901 family phage tail tape measure protein
MTAPGGGDTRTATVNLNANVNPYSQQMQAATADTNSMASAVDRLDSKLDGISKRAGKKLLNLSRDDFAVLAGATADAATFQKQLSTLSATAAITGTSFAGIKNGIEQTFQKFPEARGQIVALAESISDLGVTSARDITSLTQTFVKLGAATGEGVEPLAQGLVQLSRLMGNNNAQQIGNYANSLLVVSKNSGVSATGVLSFAQSIAPMARQAGIGEAAILGISAAFSKAGADGYVAANTFNGIVSDITSLTASGSPDLAKYANLIGVTVSQFKSMDKTTALTDIFTAITKQGPEAINTLNRLGIDGTRAQSAIAAVMQSGGLKEAIAQATGSANDQSALNKGSNAAFNNLSDGLSRLRNEFVEFGTMIGTTFLTPLSKMVSMLDTALSAVNNFIRPFAPIIAVLAATAGALSAVGGAALSVASVVGTIGLARLLVKSAPVRALREGVAVGSRALDENGKPIRVGDPLAAETQYAAHGAGLRKMSALNRAAYVTGAGMGNFLPEPTTSDGPSIGRQVARGALVGPLRLGTAFAKGNASMTAQAGLNDFERAKYQDNPEATRGFRSSFKSAIANNKTQAEEQTLWEATAAAMKSFTGAMIQATAATGKLGVSMLRPSNWHSDPAAGIVGEDGKLVPQVGRWASLRASAGNVAGSAASLAGKVGKGAIGFAGGPVGASILGTIGAVEAYSAITNKTNAQNAVTGNSLNPLEKLNDQIGVTTTTMANFNTAVGSATNTLSSKIPAGVTSAQAAHVTSSDIASFGNAKVTDKTIAAFAKHDSKKDVAGVTALAQSYNMSDPKTLAAFKDNLISAGYDQKTIDSALSGFVNQDGTVKQGATPNYANLAGQVVKTEGLGTDIGNNQSTAGGKINAAALTSISVQNQNNQLTHSLGYSNAKTLQDSTTYLGALAAKAKSARGPAGAASTQALNTALATLTGGKASDFSADNVRGTYLGGTSQTDILKLLGTSKSGKSFLNAYTQGVSGPLASAVKKGTATPEQLQQYLNSSSSALTTTDDTSANIAKVTIGGAGKFANNSSVVQQAIQKPSDANLQTAAMMALYNQVTSTTKSIGDANKAFDGIKAAVQDTTDPLYQMADAAKAYANSQEQQFVLPTMSKEGQFKQVATDYATAQQSANENPNDPTINADAQTAQQNYKEGQESYRQYLLNLQQMAISYGTQMQRAQEDNNTQLQRNQLAFYIQQTQAQQDFNRQNMLSVRDFGIQMARQAQSDSESIYNPYQRVNAETTVSASTLVENLQDQNQKIQQQYAQLEQLKKMGVSQNAIDTLQLSDPSNAQQLNSIIGGIVNDPSLVAQINKAVGTRLAATTQLTQSSFSETFRNTTSDFQRQLNDTATSYDIQKQRAVDSQSLALSQMAQDYNKMVTRSGQDLTTSLTQLYGSYATVSADTMAAINKDIGAYSPKIAKDLVAQITAAQAAVSATLDPGIAAAAPATGAASADKASGKAPAASNSYIASLLDPRKTATGHATGGISTQAHLANISEGNKAEAIVPLDATGVKFMASFANSVSMALLRQMNVQQYPSRPSGVAGSSTSMLQDNSMTISGPVTVEGVTDIKSLAAGLQKQQRLKALSMPPASTAG